MHNCHFIPDTAIPTGELEVWEKPGKYVHTMQGVLQSLLPNSRRSTVPLYTIKNIELYQVTAV
jgi:hypothetical protein